MPRSKKEPQCQCGTSLGTELSTIFSACLLNLLPMLRIITPRSDATIRSKREIPVTRISRQDVLRYLDIRPRQLRAWERNNLIPRCDSYSLEDIGRLRTLRDLSTRFSPSRIVDSIGAMERVSGLANPLLDARAMVGGSRMHFWHGGFVTDPLTRQLVFNFGPPGTPRLSRAGAKPTPFKVGGSVLDARVSEMFLEAIQHEDAGDSEGAAALYEQILGFRPQHAPASINLGTICYNRRQFLRAEQLYRGATVADPHYSLAFFDLGNVLDELKRLPEAIKAYQTAIQLVPAYSDAHYNLALAFERVGEPRSALRHWAAYVRLDVGSRWAMHARKQIRRILDRDQLAIVRRVGEAVVPRALPQHVRPGAEISTAG
jgi:tetratricopeptide (TPR) repeat protein